jgi:predicted dehydrogenase
MTSGYYVDKGYHSLLKIWGSAGWIELRRHGADTPLAWYSNTAGKVRQLATLPAGGNSYETFVRHAVRSATGLEQPVVSTSESQRALSIVFAIYKSAASGQSQRVAGV